MRGAPVRPIVIAAGGTGGHFFPAEALASELAMRGRRIALMTDARSAGMASVAFESRERFVLAGSGVFGRGRLRGALALAQLAGSAVQARKILGRLDASVVVGFGGYPCVAPVLGARLLGRRPYVLLHDQNAVLGRANRLMSRLADCLALTHAATTQVPRGVATVVTGNPVRAAITAIAGTAYPATDGLLRLVVLGGSQGARVFSDVLPDALLAMPAALRARLRVSQQCRPEDLERVRACYGGSGIDVELASFFTDIPERLAAAHLVIARAGASTVSELAVVGRPALLVPLPGAIDDDQTANARALADAGGAWVMPQPGFTSAALAARLAALFADPAILARAAACAAGCGNATAAAALADLVEQFADRERVA